MKKWKRLASAGVAVCALVGFSLPPDDADYIAEIESFRSEREANLTKDDGWLTVAGLYWLREGENWIGTDATNDFVLPAGSAPGVVGVFELENRKTTFRADDSVSVTQEGRPVRTVELEMGEEHALAVGELRLWLHYSGERLAIRLRDPGAAIRRDFTGLKWFPIDRSYRCEARFTPYALPKKVELLNVLGDVEAFESPGYVELELKGQLVRMEPLSAKEGSLWLVFRDGTSGKESYPAARFLRTEAPVDGKVIIDFNRAYNPPCAYNPHTTCPMPTKENRLELRIEAGEKMYQSHS